MKSLSKLILTLSLLIGTVTAANAVILPPQINPPLNQVMFQVNAEQWVTTANPKVIIAVNAATAEDNLSDVYGSIKQKLRKVGGDTQWRISTFQRSQDKSGLEQVYVTAEARLPEAQLNKLREQLKSISKAGETYTIAGIDYSPTLIERQAALADLRTNLYNQIKLELAKLNATYPNQKYVVHTIDFMENNEAPPVPGPVMFMAKQGNVSDRNAGTTLPVSNNLQLSARVILAAQM